MGFNGNNVTLDDFDNSDLNRQMSFAREDHEVWQPDLAHSGTYRRLTTNLPCDHALGSLMCRVKTREYFEVMTDATLSEL